MDNKKSLIIVVIILAVLIGGAGYAYNYLGNKVDTNNLAQTQPAQSSDYDGGQNEQSDSKQQEGTQAPDFVVTDLDGNQIRLSDFRGKPVVLNFWASWCGPCKMEMPDFEDAYNTYKDDIHFVMVNLTDGDRETVETAHQFISDAGYTFPVYYDTMMEAAVKYGVSSVPRTYFVDGNGNMIAYAQSMLDRNTLQKGIDMIYQQ